MVYCSFEIIELQLSKGIEHENDIYTPCNTCSSFSPKFDGGCSIMRACPRNGEGQVGNRKCMEAMIEVQI